jgi:hypothetical protein
MQTSTPENVFAVQISGVPRAQAVDAESRIRMVQGFTLEQCNSAFHVPRLQKTVAVALLRRVRELRQRQASVRHSRGRR